MKKMEQGSPGMERAMKSLEQAKARYEEERRKANEKRRKAENHHKYMMGGIIVKYFPDCYEYEEGELNGFYRRRCPQRNAGQRCGGCRRQRRA